MTIDIPQTFFLVSFPNNQESESQLYKKHRFAYLFLNTFSELCGMAKSGQTPIKTVKSKISKYLEYSHLNP